MRTGGSGLPRLATRLPRPSASLAPAAPPPPPSSIPTAVADPTASRVPAEAPPLSLKPGDPVLVDGEPGTVRFLGHTLFAEGLWAGVELARGIGKNDGSVGRKRYFFCQRGHGLFAPVSKVVRYDPAPPSPSPPPEPEMTPEPELYSPRRREDLNLPVGNSTRGTADGTESGASSSAAAAGAAALSPSGDLWWDNTEDSVGDQLDDVELLQDVDMDELSMGILTPEQMGDDSQLLVLPSDELGRSLELLTSPDPDMPADRTLIHAEPTPERVRLTSDEGAPLNVTITIGRDPDWEDEFDAPSASGLSSTQTQVGVKREPETQMLVEAAIQPEAETAMDPEPVAASAVQEPARKPMETVEHAEPLEPATEPAKPSPRHSADGNDINHSDSDLTYIASDSNGDVMPTGDVTASMSSESSDVTLKDESSGAGEALAEPPSPDTETLALPRPQAEEVDDVGAAAVVTLVKPGAVVTETSAGDVVVEGKERKVPEGVQDGSRDQEMVEQESQECQETKPPASSPELERKKVSRAPGLMVRESGCSTLRSTRA